MKKPETIRPTSNVVFAVLGYVFISVFGVQVLFFPRGGHLVLDFVVALTLSWLIYLFWLRPKLILDEDGLRVINPFSSVYIAYKDIQDLETKWTLLIVHNGSRTRVWAAPASGRYAWAAGRVDQLNKRYSTGRDVGQETIPASQSETSHSGAAAIRIRRKMNKH